MRARGAGGANERGHSLSEVLVSIVILCVAIIPMVSMFDVGFSLATSSGHYDSARAFANEQLEVATLMSYDDLRDTFPAGATGTGGRYASSGLPVPDGTGLPAGATYSITKRYVEISPPGAGRATMTETGTDNGMLRVDVAVTWEDRSYTVSRVSAGDGG